MRKLYCDVCGNQIKYPPIDPLQKKLNESYYKIDFDIIPSIEASRHIDACISCGMKILNFIKELKPDNNSSKGEAKT